MAGGAGSIRAGAAYVELLVRDNALTRGLRMAEAKLKAFGGAIGSLGSRFMALGAPIAIALGGAAKLFADAGSNLLDMSQRTGFSVEALGELGFAAQQSGATMEDLEGGITRMNRTVAAAASGSPEAAAALNQLGTSVGDLSGLSQDARFERFAAGIAAIEDPAQRAAAAMAVFGRGGTRLLPMMAEGAEGVRRLREEAIRLGRVMSTEDAQSAEAFGDSIGSLMGGLRSVAVTIGGAMAPALRAIADLLIEGAAVVRRWVSENRAIFVVVGAVSAAVVGLGAGLFVVGRGISLIGTVLGPIAGIATFAFSTAATMVGVLASAIGLLFSPIGLIVGAVVGIAAAIAYTAASSSGALSTLGQGFGALLGIFRTAWQGISDAIAIGDWAGAANIAWLGLRIAFATGVAYLRMAWRQFSGYFVDAWDTSTTTVGSVLFAAWAGLRNTFLGVVDFLANTWDMFCAGLQIAFNEFVAVFRRGWAFIRNLFDSDARAAAIAQIDQETETANREVTAAVAANSARRAGEATAREASDNAVLDAMQQDLGRRQQERAAGRTAANSADQAGIAEMQGELQEAVDMAEYNRLVEFYQPKADGPPDPGPGLDSAQKKTDVKGTFSAFAVGGLGSDKMTQLMGDVATNTRRTADAIGNLAPQSFS